LFSIVSHWFSRASLTVAGGVTDGAGEVEEDDGMTHFIVPLSCQDPFVGSNILEPSSSPVV